MRTNTPKPYPMSRALTINIPLPDRSGRVSVSVSSVLQLKGICVAPSALLPPLIDLTDRLVKIPIRDPHGGMISEVVVTFDDIFASLHPISTSDPVVPRSPSRLAGSTTTEGNVAPPKPP